LFRAENPNECPGYHPLVRPGFAASHVFVYTPEAITDFRRWATRRKFPDILAEYKVSSNDFLTTWNKITEVQLGSTLTYLSPANKVAQFAVLVESE
jgi:hypothetical protein